MAVPISSSGGIQFTVAKSGQAEVVNFGNSSVVQSVSCGGCGSEFFHVFFDVPVPALPSGATINSASLQLFNDSGPATAGGHLESLAAVQTGGCGIPITIGGPFFSITIGHIGSCTQRSAWGTVAASQSGVFASIEIDGSSQSLGSIAVGTIDLLAMGFGPELLSEAPIRLEDVGRLDLNATLTDPGFNARSVFVIFGESLHTASATLTIDYTPAAVPVPSTLALLGIGLLALACRRRKSGA